MPVSFLPGWAKTINMFLPFRYELSFPMEILFHKIGGMELLISLLMAGFLVNCLIDVIQIFMEKGVRAYSAFGQ